eukprot:1006013-Rhodomonas_salina.1
MPGPDSKRTVLPEPYGIGSGRCGGGRGEGMPPFMGGDVPVQIEKLQRRVAELTDGLREEEAERRKEAAGRKGEEEGRERAEEALEEARGEVKRLEGE